MKKVLALILTAILMISAVPFGAFALTANAESQIIEVTFGNVSGVKGDEVSVPVTIKNNPGIATFRFEVSYDTQSVEFVSSGAGSLLTGGTFLSNTDTPNQTLVFLWNGDDNVTGDGEIAVLKFKIIATPPKTIALEVAPGEDNMFNKDEEALEYAVNNGRISIGGWTNTDNKWYYIDALGENAVGWALIDGVWYYFDNSGIMQIGWQQINGIWYYFNMSGAMQTGWLNDGGTWYYFDGSGAMVTGWLADGGTWYYFNASGAMVTGWLSEGGVWYYFNNSGAMQTGWLNDGDIWYYFNVSGAMVTDWQLIGGNWYYFDTSGAMLTGWQIIGSSSYYFYADGSMAANCYIGGYWFTASGAMA